MRKIRCSKVKGLEQRPQMGKRLSLDSNLDLSGFPTLTFLIFLQNEWGWPLILRDRKEKSLMASIGDPAPMGPLDARQAQSLVWCSL